MKRCQLHLLSAFKNNWLEASILKVYFSLEISRSLYRQQPLDSFFEVRWVLSFLYVCVSMCMGGHCVGCWKKLLMARLICSALHFFSTGSPMHSDQMGWRKLLDSSFFTNRLGRDPIWQLILSLTQAKVWPSLFKGILKSRFSRTPRSEFHFCNEKEV